MKTDATLLANNSQHCFTCVTCCVCLCTLLHVTLLCVVEKILKPVKLLSQQLPIFLLFRDRRSVAQQCWICWHSSYNVTLVGATHARYTSQSVKYYGLYPSHDAIRKSLQLFAHHYQHGRINSQNLHVLALLSVAPLIHHVSA